MFNHCVLRGTLLLALFKLKKKKLSCVHVFVCVCTCPAACIEVRGQSAGVHSLLSLIPGIELRLGGKSLSVLMRHLDAPFGCEF